MAVGVDESTAGLAVSATHRSRDMFHPLCLGPHSYWRRLQALHPRVDRAFADRARSISLISPLMTPLCSAERAINGRRIGSTEIPLAPVFIIGHWRSGTTFLHNLLSKDPQFGYVTLFQTLAPGAFLLGRRTLQPLLALRSPNTRPMDDVKIRMPYPSEEEFALAHLCPQSAYLGWYFPNDWQELFSRYALMRGISGDDKREWKAAYRELLIKATIYFGGRRLVLKNPMNTARISALREMFPDAKFIHIHRNPYDVYSATLHLFREVLKVVSLQEVSEAHIRSCVLDFYPEMMNEFWAQRGSIPDGNYADVRYDDLVGDPLSQLERIYGELGLPDWRDAVPEMERLLGSRRKHRPNRYADEVYQRDLVDEQWGFAFDQLGYERRGRRPQAARISA